MSKNKLAGKKRVDISAKCACAHEKGPLMVQTWKRRDIKASLEAARGEHGKAGILRHA